MRACARPWTKSNHDYYLREQIHAIQEELGEDEDEELRALRAACAIPKWRARPASARKELSRLARTSIHAPEPGAGKLY